jgi:hypothetical protein
MGAALGEGGAQAAADQLGQRLGREEEGLVGGMPEAAVIGEAAAGDEAVDVGMIVQLLRPGADSGASRPLNPG